MILNRPIVSLVAISLLISSCKAPNANQVPTPEVTPNVEPAPSVSSAAGYLFPPEYAPHSRIWLSWPTYANKADWSTEAVQAEIINALHKYSDVGVVMLVQDKEEEAARKKLTALKVNVKKVEFKVVPHMDIWMRDMGPNFVKKSDGSGLLVADFNFNTWGYEDPSSKGSLTDGAVDQLIAKQLGYPTLATKVISEGGNREFDSTGTLMLTEAVEIERNWKYDFMWPDGKKPAKQSMNQLTAQEKDVLKKRLEDEYRRLLGVKKVIWIPRGVPEDDLTFDGPKGKPGNLYYTLITTGGHIDEFARFAPENTILLGEITPEDIAEETNPSFKDILTDGRARLEEAYAILKEAKNANGEDYKIVRIPMPPLMAVTMKPGDGVFDYLASNEIPYARGPRIDKKTTKFQGLLAASYLNFLVTNDVVLFQSYEDMYASPEYKTIAKRGRKAESIAMARIQSAFPGRTVARIHPKAINVGGGGVHCITQQEPQL